MVLDEVSAPDDSFQNGIERVFKVHITCTVERMYVALLSWAEEHLEMRRYHSDWLLRAMLHEHMLISGMSGPCDPYLSLSMDKSRSMQRCWTNRQVKLMKSPRARLVLQQKIYEHQNTAGR